MKRASVFIPVLILLVCLVCSCAMAEESIQLYRTADYTDGHLTVSWTDSGNSGPYYVFFQYAAEDGSAQKLWLAGNTESKSFTFDWMVPGRNYDVHILNKDNEVFSQTYALPAAPDFVDGALTTKSFKPYVNPSSLEEGAEPKQARKINSLKASAIENAVVNGGTQYGFRYGMTFPTLRVSRYYDTMVAVEAPSGFLDTYYMGEVEYTRYGDNSYGEVWWYFLGSDYFANMYETQGGIATGVYTVTLYLDGAYACETTFSVE